MLSSPSGAGKTTVARQLLAAEKELVMSVSATTRPPRSGERDGDDYHFVDARTFAAMVESGELMEHATVFGHNYGTLRAAVEQHLAQGRDVLFDVDWQGCQQLRQQARDFVSIFLLPPSMADLAARLHTRAQDSPEVQERRLSRAANEMSHWAEYDYVLINGSLDRTVADARVILCAERLRRNRSPQLADFVRGLGIA